MEAKAHRLGITSSSLRVSLRARSAGCQGEILRLDVFGAKFSVGRAFAQERMLQDSNRKTGAESTGQLGIVKLGQLIHSGHVEVLSHHF